MMFIEVAVWCSVLQCVAVCCKVLQCVAVRCSALQCDAKYCSVLQCVAHWLSLLCDKMFIEAWRDVHWIVTLLSLICDVTQSHASFIDLWRDCLSWICDATSLNCKVTAIELCRDEFARDFNWNWPDFHCHTTWHIHMWLSLNCDVTCISHAKRHCTEDCDMRWLWLVGSLKIYVSFAE